jgi:hypothetical protein
MSNEYKLSADWQQSYTPLHVLPALAWSWEFLRRNPTFRDRWSQAQPAWEDAGRVHGIRVIRIAPPRPPEPSPCLWSSSPEASAFDAAVAWNADHVPAVLKAVAVPPRCAFGAAILDLESFEVEKTLILDGDKQSLVLRHGARSLQLDIRGTPMTEIGALLVDTVLVSGDPTAQLRAFACLRDLRATGELLAGHFPPMRRAQRLAAVLQALDGYLAGASHREIAAAILGRDRVDRDWNDPNQQLRDYVRRAISSGIALMERGYQNFLR